MSDHALDISFTVNGERVSERVEPRKTLVDFLARTSRSPAAMSAASTGSAAPAPCG